MYSKIGGDILQYLYNQSLLRRLPIGHPEILLAENELARIEAGRYGELRVLRELGLTSCSSLLATSSFLKQKT